VRSNEFLLSGGILPLNSTPGIQQLAWLAPARWGLGATAATTDLNHIAPRSADLPADPLWLHQASTWLTDMAAMIALSVVFVFIAGWRPQPATPGPPARLRRGVGSRPSRSRARR
jgi:hypothetical protein